MKSSQDNLHYNDEHYQDETVRQAIHRAEGNQDAPTISLWGVIGDESYL